MVDDKPFTISGEAELLKFSLHEAKVIPHTKKISGLDGGQCQWLIMNFSRVFTKSCGRGSENSGN
jgi:hypothetical protein